MFQIRALMRCKVVLNQVATLHHKANALQLGNVGKGIAGNGNEIRKFPGLNSAHAVLPAQHFRGVNGDRANDFERGHSGVM